MEVLTVRLSKEMLVEMLRQIPKSDLDAILNEIEGDSKLRPVRISAQSLDQLTGICSIGGDALQDTEAIYE